MVTTQEKLILDEINRRVSRAMDAALRTAAESYRSKVTQEQSPPTSEPGEYPHEDTGQGQENISYGLSPKPNRLEGPEGRFGLFGEDSPIPQFPGQDHRGGEHLQWLRMNQGRLGMDHSFAEDLQEIRAAARRELQQ